MDIVAITDLHGHREAVERASGVFEVADLVVITGDITHFGREREAKEVIDAVTARCTKLLAVPGNCDYPEVGSFLAKAGCSIDLHCIEIEGLIIAGIGGSLPCPGMTPNERSEDEFTTVLDEIKKQLPSRRLDLFISHQPPWNTRCDLAHGGTHVGSRTIRRFVEEVKPAVCLTGHIHEATGEDRIESTVVANPGPLILGGYTNVIITAGKVTVKIMKAF